MIDGQRPRIPPPRRGSPDEKSGVRSPAGKVLLGIRVPSLLGAVVERLKNPLDIRCKPTESWEGNSKM